MSRAVALLAILLPAACSSHKHIWLHGFPLALPPEGVCCWQALQSLDIDYRGQEYRLTAALAYHKEAVTLAVMGEFGQRLLTIRQSAAGVQTEASERLPKDLPAAFLLTLIQTLWFPDAGRTVASDWAVARTAAHLIIRHRNRDLVVMDKPKQRFPTAGEVVHIQHLKQPLTIVIASLSVQRL
ncbi:MAG: DUF3261 domain-containing protein [Pseudomonadales bacterium]